MPQPSAATSGASGPKGISLSGAYGEFFRLASELLARHHEGRKSCCSELTDDELRQSFAALEAKIGLLDRLGKLREQGDTSKIRKHTVLAFMSDGTVEIFGFSQPASAVHKESELLADKSCVNVVYVSSANAGSIRSSYRNYLTNPEDFVGLLRQALS